MEAGILLLGVHEGEEQGVLKLGIAAGEQHVDARGRGLRDLVLDGGAAGGVQRETKAAPTAKDDPAMPTRNAATSSEP